MYGLKRVWLFVVVGLLVFASCAPAAVIFQDDFQTDSATSCASTTEDKNPAIGLGDIGGSWSISEPAIRFVNVVNDLVPYADPYVPGENKYLKVKRNDNVNPKARAWEVLADASQTLNRSQIEESFNFQLRSAGSNVASSVNFYNAAPDAFTNNLFELNFNPDGSMDYWDTGANLGAGASVALSTTHLVDQWNDVKIALDTANRTFTVTVGAASAAGSWTANENQFATVLFSPATNANEFFVDNVKLDVVVPEPGSALLLAAGALGLLVYAWRKRK